MTLNFCLHPTYNNKSKDLVNEPALLRATADYYRIILDLPQFIIKSSCLLLAVPRNSPKCKKHSEEIISHERERDMRHDLKLRIV